MLKSVFFPQVNYQDKFKEFEILELWTQDCGRVLAHGDQYLQAKEGSPHSRMLEITYLMH